MSDQADLMAQLDIDSNYHGLDNLEWDDIYDEGSEQVVECTPQEFMAYLNQYLSDGKPPALSVVIDSATRAPLRLGAGVPLKTSQSTCSSPDYLRADIERAEENQKMVFVHLESSKDDGSRHYSVIIDWDGIPF